jgi:hypothetical protein
MLRCLFEMLSENEKSGGELVLSQMEMARPRISLESKKSDIILFYSQSINRWRT